MKTMLPLLFPVLCLMFAASGSLWAQGNVALKTNLLYGGYTATPNLGVEFGLNRHLTLEVSGGYNPWNLKNTSGNRKRVHYLVQPELRYFFRNRFDGHYLGVHGFYGQYNINRYELPLLLGKGSGEFRHEGSAYGGGISYGYLFALGRRWGVELGIGAGVAQLNYTKYDCVNCGEKRQREARTYYGVTRASVSVVYLLKGKHRRAVSPVSEVSVAPLVAPLSAPLPTPLSADTLIAVPAITPVATLPPSLAVDSLLLRHPYLVPLPDREQRPFLASNEEEGMQIDFIRSGSTIDPYYKQNHASLDSLVSVLQRIERSGQWRVSRIVITGFSSVDGTLIENDRLAWERADAMRTYLIEHTGVRFGQITLYNGSEDWSTLRRLVEQCAEMESRYDVLRIIDTVPILSGREKRLMDLAGGMPYRYMKRYLFPKLRNAALVKVYYTE